MAKMVRVSAKPNAQHFINGVPVVTAGPDGLHGKGDMIASADAYAVSPQDCAPRMRAILFGQRSS